MLFVSSCFRRVNYPGGFAKRFTGNTAFCIFIKFSLVSLCTLLMTEVTSSKHKLLEPLDDTSSVDDSQLQFPEQKLSPPPAPLQDEFALLKWTSSMHATERMFNEVIASIKTAIAHDIHPERIGRGTSGSYFARDSDGQIVGVFKPSDEEQYSKNNPNLLKKLQRFLLPCFYGRSW